jgi:PKD repeat protein
LKTSKRRNSEMKNKKILAIWLVIMVLGVGVNSITGNGTVILHPGYITGSLMVGTEDVTGGILRAYSIPSGFDATDSTGTDTYLLAVEGDFEYQVRCTTSMVNTTPTEYWTNSELFMGYQNIYVPIGDTVNLDFSLNPGYITPVVTVVGGEIQKMEFYASIRGRYRNAYHVIHPKSGYTLSGTTTFPMQPWESIDLNNDGDYTDLGETYLSVYGRLWSNGIQYTLPGHFINVIQGESTVVEWFLNVEPGSISGSVDVAGEVVSRYYVDGKAYIDGVPVEFSDYTYPGTNDYWVDVPAADWDIYPTLYFGNTYLQLDPDSVSVSPGEDVIHDWNIAPGYVTGNIELYGAHGDPAQTNIFADREIGPNLYSAYTSTYASDYRLILDPGNWKIGSPYTRHYFYYGSPWESSYLQVADYTRRGELLKTITPGNIISDVNFSYGTATITVYFIVEGGGELKTPEVFASSNEGVYPDLISSSAYSRGSNALTTLGKSTITVLGGSHIVSTYANVAGSRTKFGEFTVTVEPGDVIEQDIGAPTVDVSQPEGLQHICGSSVGVDGLATDDSAISTITVNGQEVELTSTNNPEDANEVSFSTTVNNLDYGENIITIIVTDTFDKSITVERTVIRDVCNHPPEIISISGPVNPVAAGSPVAMTGTFTDPDIEDTHTAIWDWGDGITSPGTVDQADDVVIDSHLYDSPGEYIITLTVTDSFDESVTATYTQYVNILPEITSITGPVDPVAAGTSISITGIITDPDIGDTHTATWDWGDGTSSVGTVNQESDTVTDSHIYDIPGEYTITLTVVDFMGESDTTTYTQYVNIPPDILSITGPADPVAAGTAIGMIGIFLDPDTGDTHIATWDWGDGISSAVTVNQGSDSVIDSHTYDMPGIYTITLTVTDSMGESDTETYSLYVNLPPDILSITGPIDPILMGSQIEMTGLFTDLDTGDAHTAIWDWGDNTISEGYVYQLTDVVTGSHVYNTPGVYQITLTVIDLLGESDTTTWLQYIVIYDPSAGFVTGGGWIDSSAGAYAPDPSLSGKATFGFVSKYHKGTTVPSGNTEFQFKAGDMNFHSDSYEWLVIAGTQAKFKGTGTINGEGSYKFMVTAVDRDLRDGRAPDSFRIRIWLEHEETGQEITIYDNGLDGTELGGGSIKIHTD